MARQISLMIVGAGDRGQLYADLAARDPRVRIAAVADPDERRRNTSQSGTPCHQRAGIRIGETSSSSPGSPMPP